ncbi:MAG: hypothetical protein ACRDQ9_05030, partial [Pseudonocardiaceae bacterium]
AVSVTELDGQHMELLAARTVLSMFFSGGGKGGSAHDGGSGGGVSDLAASVTGLVNTSSINVPPNAPGDTAS